MVNIEEDHENPFKKLTEESNLGVLRKIYI